MEHNNDLVKKVSKLLNKLNFNFPIIIIIFCKGSSSYLFCRPMWTSDITWWNVAFRHLVQQKLLSVFCMFWWLFANIYSRSLLENLRRSIFLLIFKCYTPVYCPPCVLYLLEKEITAQDRKRLIERSFTVFRNSVALPSKIIGMSFWRNMYLH